MGGPRALATTTSTPPRAPPPRTTSAEAACREPPPLPAALLLLPGDDAALTAKLTGFLTVCKLTGRCTWTGKVRRSGCGTRSGYIFHISKRLGKDATDLEHKPMLPSLSVAGILCPQLALRHLAPPCMLAVVSMPTVRLTYAVRCTLELALAQVVGGIRRLPRCMILELTGIELLLVRCMNSKFEGKAARLGGEPLADFAVRVATDAVLGITLRGKPPVGMSTSCVRPSPHTRSVSVGGVNVTAGLTWLQRLPPAWRLFGVVSPRGMTGPLRRPPPLPALRAWRRPLPTGSPTRRARPLTSRLAWRLAALGPPLSR